MLTSLHLTISMLLPSSCQYPHATNLMLPSPCYYPRPCCYLHPVIPKLSSSHYYVKAIDRRVMCQPPCSSTHYQQQDIFQCYHSPPTLSTQQSCATMSIVPSPQTTVPCFVQCEVVCLLFFTKYQKIDVL